ncbi:zinc-dependent metalloprotease [Lysobacter sp. 5GHs7-4]|uniref:M12 family metallo-peptidase n=1 Tax=Lysobacter sp. 5GHs7-4 TaxID=2904253 RepID=UPI001E5F3005|nr:M12 family metallo-peptidase [Lysobacter sp. 5GHs7-4]UHQ23662.1 zinc-dependent metalloprotease [Lysobacter sp. 5GHs7-4]
MQKAILALSIAGLVAATVNVAGAQSAAVPELFQAHSSHAAAAAAVPASVNHMINGKSAQWAASVSIDRKVLTGAQRELMLTMPEGARLHMRLAKSYRTSAGDVVWSGADALLPTGQLKLGGVPPSTALFVVRGQRVTGQIATGTGEVYEVLTSEDGAQQFLVKRDPASLEGADDTPAHSDLPQQPDRGTVARPMANALLADTIIRVLQVYTPEAVSELGGQNSANDRAAFFIAQSNTAFANNALTVKFESAGVRFPTQGQATNDSSTLVSRIKGTSDGWYDAYSTTERNNTAADLVTLVVRDGLSSPSGLLCGQAAAIGASAANGFFVQNHSCSTFTFVHEAAHLFGARHDNDPTTTPFSYGHGYVNSAGNFRTIMAVNSNPQPRIGYFSTTDQNYVSGGVSRPLGTSTRNNERVMRERAAAMAAFR